MITLELIRHPGSALAYDVDPVRLATRLRTVATNILSMGLVVFMVVGFIVLGIATLTEAAACSVLEVMTTAVGYGAPIVQDDVATRIIALRDAGGRS